MVRELIRSCTKIICRRVPGQPETLAWILKLRSFGIEISDLFMREFPEAKLIFLYRDALTWAGSAMRAFVDEDYDNPAYIRNAIDRLKPIAHLVDSELANAEELPEIGAIPAYMWLSVMERWLNLCEMGKPAFSLRFEDLIAAPKDAIRAVFRFCGLTDVQWVGCFAKTTTDYCGEINR